MTDLTLKTDFVEGDTLWALGTTSTSGINGITTQINTNTATRMKHSTSNMTPNSFTGGGEIIIISSTISALALSSQITVIAPIRAALSGGRTATFKLKIGAVNSEVLKQTQTLTASTTSASTCGGCMVWTETGLTWTNNINVIITAQLDSGEGIAYCDSLLVLGT